MTNAFSNSSEIPFGNEEEFFKRAMDKDSSSIDFKSQMADARLGKNSKITNPFMLETEAC